MNKSGNLTRVICRFLQDFSIGDRFTQQKYKQYI